MAARPTVWVLGDQLHRRLPPLGHFEPGGCRVLLVRSDALLRSRRWHRQRLHVVLSAMSHFAAELEAEGFEVDHRRAPTLAAGLRAHADDHHVGRVIAAEAKSWDARDLLDRLGVDCVRHEAFLCHEDEFAAWAATRSRVRMEDFYRWQRRRMGVLMDGDEPAGGRWNFDSENREPPPTDGRAWPPLTRFELDHLDRAVLAELPGGWGAEPDGAWPVTRAQALARLEEFVAAGLPRFGRHEDAMLAGEPKLAHSALSSAMNLSLLHPLEVIDAAEAAYRRGDAPIASVEGFIRQVLGWREYVWGTYWWRMPEHRHDNHLGAYRTVPPALTGAAPTQMACVADVVGRLRAHGYNHHIERLMVLGNLALTAGVEPRAMAGWMQASYVDGAEWVMVPNVIGMALHADRGRMATKPYASGGAYIDRMSDFCGGCRFEPKRRTGEDACPFTSLYWDFLARHEATFSANPRMRNQLAGLRRLADLDAVRARAAEVLEELDAGRL